MISLNYTLAAALMACVVPFLIGDAVKIVLASVISPMLRKALKKQRA
jgi:biotin transport system substrate-specific component